MTSSSSEPHIRYQNTLSNSGAPPPNPPLQNKYKPNNNYDPNKSASQMNAKTQPPKVDSRNSDKMRLAAGGFCFKFNMDVCPKSAQECQYWRYRNLQHEMLYFRI